MTKKKFLGFGLGPIQTGLMLYEAIQSGNFGSPEAGGAYTVVEIDPELVEAVRRNNNSLTINIAGREGVRRAILGGIRVLRPQDPADRRAIVEAIGEADEMATAVPSVAVYGAGGDCSIARLLAEGLNPARPQILYAAENHNHAAAILTAAIREHAPEGRLANFQALDTVIGKMSGVIQSPETIARLGLAPQVPGSVKAVLVEEFNRILVSRVRLAGVRRGLASFIEKDDLLPFEEAKLSHPGQPHALLGYMAWLKGYRQIAEARGDAALMALAERVFVGECGAALVDKYGSLGDPLFTPEGFRAYALDLLDRMTNPYLNDEVARVCRDPRRKLGWSDRIFGTMRLALEHEIVPQGMAQAAAAALHHLILSREPLQTACPTRPADLTPQHVHDIFSELWTGQPADALQGACLRLVWEARRKLMEP
ncbi:MAG: hypothetical protein M1457_01595 [bacterium]|nr:hypothetical protein [bacterium]